MTGTAARDEYAGAIRRHAPWIVAMLALCASMSGIANGFALDDLRVIVEDTRAHAFHDLWRVFTEPYYLPKYGASLYRPFTSAAFSLQWIAGHGSPLLFHVVSILSYAGVSVAVYRLAILIADDTTAFLAAAIFAVHPVHVEAVANVVGQAELAAALLSIVAVSKYIEWRRSRTIRVREIAILCLMYAAALMFKEHTIVLPALLMATELLPSRDDSPVMRRVIQQWQLLASMAVVGAVFVAVRAIVAGQLAGAGDQAGVFVGHGFGDRLLTMLPVVLHWIRLFVWPASLSADYSSPQIDVQTSFSVSMIPAIAAIAALVLIAWQSRKSRPSATFAFSWTGLTLLIPSNLIVVTGFVLAERSLFLPSVGVSILLAMAIIAAARAASEPAHKLVVAGTIAILVAGIARSSLRNPVWKNNEILFRQTVEDAPLSWKAHSMLGELLVTQGKGEGVVEMALGVKLAPKNDYLTRVLTARRLNKSRQYAAAVTFYKEALALDPSSPEVREELAYCLAQIN